MSCTTAAKEEMNYARILDVLVSQESLDIPVWACAEIGEGYSVAAWLNGAMTVGIVSEYPSEEDPETFFPVHATSPDGMDEEIPYELQDGEQDKRRFFLLADDGPHPIERQKLLIHKISFYEFSKAVASALGVDFRRIRRTAHIEGLLWCLQEIPVRIFFACAFSWERVHECLVRIHGETPNQRFVLFVIGERWENSTRLNIISQKFCGIVCPLTRVMQTTSSGFEMQTGYTLEGIIRGQITALTDLNRWEELTIYISQNYDLEYRIYNASGEYRVWRAENIRDCGDFFSKRRATYGVSILKPAARLLYTLAPDYSGCTIKMDNSQINEARKVLVRHLRTIFPNVQASPFHTTRKQGQAKTIPLFSVMCEPPPQRAMPGFIENRQQR